MMKRLGYRPEFAAAVEASARRAARSCRRSWARQPSSWLNSSTCPMFRSLMRRPSPPASTSFGVFIEVHLEAKRSKLENERDELPADCGDEGTGTSSSSPVRHHLFLMGGFTRSMRRLWASGLCDRAQLRKSTPDECVRHLECFAAGARGALAWPLPVHRRHHHRCGHLTGLGLKMANGLVDWPVGICFHPLLHDDHVLILGMELDTPTILSPPRLPHPLSSC